jgi:uncharacterized protein YecT (DUF1311 family)
MNGWWVEATVQPLDRRGGGDAIGIRIHSRTTRLSELLTAMFGHAAWHKWFVCPSLFSRSDNALRRGGLCDSVRAMIRPGMIGALLCLVLLPGLALAADDPTADACHQRDTTIAIMDCVNGLTAQWDKRLNTAYQAALKASESAARKDGLVRAERAWLAFRSANCGWYDAQEGTIREIAGADCMLDMTRGRATELEDAMKP